MNLVVRREEMSRDKKHLVKDAFEHFKAMIILEIAASKGERVVVEFTEAQKVNVRIGEMMGTGKNFLEAFIHAHDRWERLEARSAEVKAA